MAALLAALSGFLVLLAGLLLTSALLLTPVLSTLSGLLVLLARILLTAALLSALILVHSCLRLKNAPTN